MTAARDRSAALLLDRAGASTAGGPRGEGARRLIVPAAVAAAVGLVAWVVGAFVDPAQALHSYLAAYTYGVSIALGALFLIMIGHTTGARWFVIVRPLAETIAGTLPAFAVLFIPIVLGMRYLYPWVPPLDGLDAAAIADIQRKQAWLNVPFFLIRAIVYFAVWLALLGLLRRWSLRQARDPAAAPEARAAALSGIGLVATSFTMTFAAVDWLMSLRPGWSSTIFGVYWFAGGILAALALMVLATHAFQRDGTLRGLVGPSHYYALGRLLLTFTVFWAYIAFSQGFLMYIADIPREVSWYIARTMNGWGPVLIVLIVGHFGLPFFALLNYRIKRRPERLAWVAAWLLLMHYVDMFWLVLPALADGRFTVHWLDLAALMVVVGGALAAGAWRLTDTALIPYGDPRLYASIHYDSR